MNNFIRLLSTILLLTFSNVIGQIPTFNSLWNDNFQHTNTSAYSNEGRFTLSDPNTGDVYVLADVTSDLDEFGVVSGPVFHYVSLLKYSAIGDLLNQVDINVGAHISSGFVNRSAFGLSLDNVGYIYIGYMSHNATTGYDVHIGKYDNTLTQYWTSTFNAGTDDEGLVMKVAANNSVYALVNSSAGANVRTRIIKATNGATSANPLYSFSASPDIYTTMDIDSNQDIYLSGYRLNGTIKVISTASVSSTGVLRWLRQDNCGFPNSNHFARDITVGADGFIYITGSSTGNAIHGVDVVTMKFGSVNGKKMWESFINFSVGDGGYAIQVPNASTIFVVWTAVNTIYIEQLSTADGASYRRATYAPVPAAQFSSLDGVTFGDFKISPSGIAYLAGTIAAIAPNTQKFTSAFLVRINFFSRGPAKIEYASILEGTLSSSYKSTSVSLDPAAEVIFWLSEQSNSYVTHLTEYLNLGAFNTPSLGLFRDDNEQGSISDDLTTELYKVNLQPNPAENLLNVYGNQPILKIEIYDMRGKLSLEITNNQISSAVEIDLTNLDSGLYMAKVIAVNGDFQNVKFIRK